MAAAAGANPAPGLRLEAVPPERRENVLLRELVAAFSHLSALASQDADVDGVVRLVARRTGCWVAVVGPDLVGEPDVLSAAPPDAAQRFTEAVGGDRLAAVLGAAAQNRRAVSLSGLSLSGPAADGPLLDRAGLAGAALDRAVVVPVLVGHDVAAHLVTVASDEPELGDDLLLLLAEHAATVCGIILGRERVVAAAAGRARTDLVEGLLLARDRDAAEADRWAGHLGFARGTEHHVLAVGVVETPDRARVLATAEHTITRGRSAAIVAVRESEVVAVVPAPDGSRPGLDAVRELAQRCRAAVLDRHPGADVVAGIGGSCREAGEIARSYTEARSAIDAARRMPRAPAVVAFGELGVLRLLLQVPDLGELRAFADDVLGDVARDGRTGADLLGTLVEWFRCNGSPQRTAGELHVHPNTVAYRIRRVEEISGLRLDHHRDRLLAQLACEIVQVLP
jgi:hypothetical protein